MGARNRQPILFYTFLYDVLVDWLQMERQLEALVEEPLV